MTPRCGSPPIASISRATIMRPRWPRPRSCSPMPRGGSTSRPTGGRSARRMLTSPPKTSRPASICRRWSPSDTAPPARAGRRWPARRSPRRPRSTRATVSVAAGSSPTLKGAPPRTTPAEPTSGRSSHVSSPDESAKAGRAAWSAGQARAREGGPEKLRVVGRADFRSSSPAPSRSDESAKGAEGAAGLSLMIRRRLPCRRECACVAPEACLGTKVGRRSPIRRAKGKPVA